jgi:hypothetical protein
MVKELRRSPNGMHSGRAVLRLRISAAEKLAIDGATTVVNICCKRFLVYLDPWSTEVIGTVEQRLQVISRWPTALARMLVLGHTRHGVLSAAALLSRNPLIVAYATRLR